MSDGSFYIGQTQDLSARLAYHNNGYGKYTRNKKPWELRWYVLVETRSEAIILERKHKSLKNRNSILAFINKPTI